MISIYSSLIYYNYTLFNLSFLKNKSKDKDPFSENTIALDVGTEYVKSAIFSITNGQVHIKGYSKAKQQSDAMKGAMIVDLQNVIENCDLAIGEALSSVDKSEPLPKKVILGIAGELVYGITVMSSFERDNPESKIDQLELDKVISDVRKNSFPKAKEQIVKDMGMENMNIEEIDSVINDTFIDGFRVNNPIGFVGKNVSFRVFSTFSPSVHLTSLKTIAKALDLEISAIVVEPYAIARAFRGSKSDKFSAVFVDIGGGTTDLALVESGGVIGTKMFALGGRVFTKRVEQVLGQQYDIAEEKKILYSEDKLEPIEKIKIGKAMIRDAKTLVRGIHLSLEDFEDIENYPSQILLCGGGSLLPEIKTEILNYPWLQELPFTRFPKVDFILPDMLSDIIDETGKANKVTDVAALSLARMALEIKNK